MTSNSKETEVKNLISGLTDLLPEGEERERVLDKCRNRKSFNSLLEDSNEESSPYHDIYSNNDLSNQWRLFPPQNDKDCGEDPHHQQLEQNNNNNNWSFLTALLNELAQIVVSSSKQYLENGELRRYVLSSISSETKKIRNFIVILQRLNNPESSRDLSLTEKTTCSFAVVSILRESLAAKTPWKARNLHHLELLHATEVIVKAMGNSFRDDLQQQTSTKEDQTTAAFFWVLMAIATKDPKFSNNFRSALKTVNSALRKFSLKPFGLYPILQVLKALCRNPVSSSVLGKEGCVTTLVKIVQSLANKAYCPKLKVALEALDVITKQKINLILLVKQRKSVSVLMKVFSRYELFAEEKPKLAYKIVGSILNICLHLVGSESGLELFREEGGIQTLRQFCFGMKEFEDKKWDRMLGRCSSVLTKCCPAKSLPFSSSSECPLTFDLPDPEDPTNPELARFGSSAATSRETTPESEFDEDDEGEEEDEDEDDFAEEEEEDDSTETQMGNLNLRGQRFNKNSAQRHSRLMFDQFQNLDDLNLYEKFFPEFQLKKDSEKSNRFSSKFGSGSGGRRRKPYEKYAHFASNNVKGLGKFVKVPYPDIIGADSKDNAEEPLYERDRNVYREKMLRNIQKLTQNNARNNHRQISQTIFDLDLLIEEQDGNQEISSDPYPISSVMPNSNSSNKNLRSGDNQKSPDNNDSPFREKALSFESRFECGNLRKAIRVGENEYDLMLTPDINSSKHHQWFYFEVSNTRSDVDYVFNIINYEKTNSQYNFGMQPLFFSVKDAMFNQNTHWRRIGSDILYYKNHYSKNACHTNINLDNDVAAGMDVVASNHHMTASFTVRFPNEDDTCYLAYHFPYTYTKLMIHLDGIMNHHASGAFVRMATLTKTVCGRHDVPMLTITSSNDNAFLPLTERKLVFLVARVHPGETNASWLMQGTLDFLVSDHPDACALRSRFIFKIVPMLNVEGVINGCHRCGLTGEDLNRKWRRPDARLHPTIYKAKGLIAYATKVLGKQPFLFCDFHGHSRKKNFFVYGCSGAQSWLPSDNKKFKEQLFAGDSPMDFSNAFAKMCSVFDPKSCRFTVEKSRESTARIVVWREFGVLRSYTLEGTFCGSSKGVTKGHQVTTGHLQEVGVALVLTILRLLQSEVGQQQDGNPTKFSKAKSPPEVKTIQEVDEGQESSSDEERKQPHQKKKFCVILPNCS